MRTRLHIAACLLVAAAGVLAPPATVSAGTETLLLRQTDAEAAAKSEGCLTCHNGIEPMHKSGQVNLGCTDCHGGTSSIRATGLAAGSAEYTSAMNHAHV